VNTLSAFSTQVASEYERRVRLVAEVQATALRLGSQLHRLVGQLDALSCNPHSEMPPLTAVSGLLDEAGAHIAGAVSLVVGDEVGS